MPCFIMLIAYFFPRLVIAILALFTNYMSAAYQTLLWPLLGFLFLPYTTLGYAFAMNQNNGSVSGLYLVIMIVCVLVDLGVLGGGEKVRRQRTAKRIR